MAGDASRARLGWRALRVLGWGVAALSLALVVAIGWLSATLPLGGGMRPPEQPSLLIEDVQGRVFASRGVFRGERLSPQNLPKDAAAAIVAVEDRRFWSHPGIDVVGIMRALFANIRAGGVREGGSTITQQLAKMMFLSPERTIRRKAQEAILAVWLELQLSKEEILARYLDSAYFGAGAWGLDGAARRYFLKSPQELTLAESAMLAGLVKAPSIWSPVRDLAAAQGRAEVVLAAMVETGAITEDQAAAARAAPAKPAFAPDTAGGWNWYADWIGAEVTRLMGPVPANFRVETTLDPELQEIAEAVVAKWLDREGGKRRVSEAALVSLAHDGAVLAMVGGRDYGKSQFNRVTQAKRQPGSLFKLFVYLAGFEAGYSPESEASDQPISIGDWSPENFGGTYRGRVTLRQAFAESLNSVAVQLSEAVGRDKVIAMAQRLGLTSPILDVPSLALGTSQHTVLEMTRAFAAVAAGAASVEAYGIRAIRSPSGILYTRGSVAPEPATYRRAEMLSLLRAVVRQGTGRGADYGRPVAGKTGTTQDHRDAWFIGFTADAVVGVWVGNDDNSPMDQVTGSGLPVQIWRDFMAEADRRKGEAVAAMQAEARRSTRLEGRPRIIDTATLSFDGGTIAKLAGLEGQGGAAAREMADWLAGKRVECEPTGAAWRCVVDQWDLA